MASSGMVVFSSVIPPFPCAIHVQLSSRESGSVPLNIGENSQLFLGWPSVRKTRL
jgi:hypothetical protein